MVRCDLVGDIEKSEHERVRKDQGSSMCIDRITMDNGLVSFISFLFIKG